MRRFLRALRNDRRAATIIEFAIICPVMMLAIMGMSDILFQQYAQSMLTGAVQKAGRDSAIQAADTSALDAKVVATVGTLIKVPTKACPAAGAAGTWCSTRFSYDNFSEVAPEPFTDANNDGLCNNNEAFTDTNGNNQWDANPGDASQGGAGDVALYTMTMTYKRLFPVSAMLGKSSTATITATTLLKNQPYATQSITTNTTGNCP